MPAPIDGDTTVMAQPDLDPKRLGLGGRRGRNREAKRTHTGPNSDTVDAGSRDIFVPVGAVAMDGDGRVRTLQKADFSHGVSGVHASPSYVGHPAPAHAGPPPVIGSSEMRMQQSCLSEEICDPTLVRLPGEKQTRLDSDVNESNKRYLLLGVIFLAVVAAVIVAVAMAKGRNGGPTHDSRRDILASRLSYLSSDPSVMKDASTPQGKALEWLLRDIDEGGVAVDDDERVEARYALSVLYFATQGAHWKNKTNFLSTTIECQWYKVHCDPDGRVQFLNLCKCGVIPVPFVCLKTQLAFPP